MAEWDLWIDYHIVDADGLTPALVADAERDVELVVGAFVVVGNEEAESAVAEVISVEDGQIVYLRVLPGPAQQHLHLVGQRSAS